MTKNFKTCLNEAIGIGYKRRIVSEYVKSPEADLPSLKEVFPYDSMDLYFYSLTIRNDDESWAMFWNECTQCSPTDINTRQMLCSLCKSKHAVRSFYSKGWEHAVKRLKTFPTCIAAALLKRVPSQFSVVADKFSSTIICDRVVPLL
ncbi:hypothetical protein ADUPG1_011308, partial [Aduncisulcus paluster]